MRKLIITAMALILVASLAAFGVETVKEDVAVAVKPTNIERAVVDTPSRSGTRSILANDHKVLLVDARKKIRAADRRERIEEQRKQERADRIAERERAEAEAVEVSPQGVKEYAASLVGSSQFGCLDALWERESGWNHRADNPTSSAYGIPQALPGYKMASAGADWETNPYTQVRWGVSYISERYGSSCSAWNHSESVGWY